MLALGRQSRVKFGDDIVVSAVRLLELEPLEAFVERGAARAFYAPPIPSEGTFL